MRQRNLYMWRGEDVSFTIVLEGSGSIADQDFRFDLRGDREEEDTVMALVTKTIGDGLTIVDPDARTLLLVLNSADTIDLVDGQDLVGWWEVASVDPGNNAALAGGLLTIRNRSVRV